MNPEVERLFSEAADLDPNAQQHFLSEQCADPVVRAEVERLLRFDSGSERFLNTPVINLASRIETPARAERIGPYRILRQIGRGGMGAVYEAERLDGELSQRVAIKFVPIALRTDAVVERFRQERQILANLNHPNICRLLDAGTTEDGSPYLVMELIDGRPIDEWCVERVLGPRRIAALFLNVCMAVQHAHQNLVIHRDLKPSNILVTAEGEPKLLDFGIAKLIDETHARDQTTIRALTPDYASPEQIAAKPMTTATDIYSLGCVLYRLLTGQPPPRSAPDAIVPSPSSRIPELKGDLDNIMCHALHPEPELRYATVREFAEDLRRYLAWEPVRATPHRWLYLAQRWVQRKPLLAASLAALAVSIVGGGSMSLWQAKRAERRFSEVHNLANVFLFRFEEQIRDIPGTTAARQFVVSTALDYLERLARDSAGDLELKRELAAGYRKVSEVQFSSTAGSLGDTGGALRSLERARELLSEAPPTEESARVLIRTGDLQQELGRLDDSLNNLRQAQSLADDWLKTDPHNATALELAAQAAVLTGRVLRRLNHLEQAGISFERAVSMDRLALERSPQSVDVNLRIASDLGWLNSLAQQREAVDILKRLKESHGSSAAVDRGLMVGLSRLAVLEPDPRKRTQALEAAVAIARNRVLIDRQDTRALMDLQSVLTRQGSALLDARERDKAARVLEEAVVTARQLVQRDPAGREARLNLGIALGTQAESLAAGAAYKNRQEARQLYQDLLRTNRNDAKVLFPYGYNQAGLVELTRATGEFCDEGLPLLQGHSENREIAGAYTRLRTLCGK